MRSAIGTSAGSTASVAGQAANLAVGDRTPSNEVRHWEVSAMVYGTPKRWHTFVKASSRETAIRLAWEEWNRPRWVRLRQLHAQPVDYETHTEWRWMIAAGFLRPVPEGK